MPDPQINRVSATVPATAAIDLPPVVKKYKALRLMNDSAKRTLMAILNAAAETGLDLTIQSPTRALIVSIADYDPQLDANDQLDYTALRDNTNPLWLLKVLPNMAASHFAILTKSGGPSHSVATAEEATKLAHDLIVGGEADTVICADLATCSASIHRR
ncbi:MAG: hypothetical protein LBH01_05495 [Verrucomicrobiales bacterium]|jgi:3-oxoacyl-(acyl-carrier-protein) synthase|nr:hypothetical protein [Verrucomicrobiales bacterium]